MRRKTILWAIRTGMSFRRYINKDNCNHFLVHVFNNGEMAIDSTYKKDSKYKSLFNIKCPRCKKLKESSQ